MKKISLLLTLLLFIATTVSAHNLWLETDATAKIGHSQQVHIYYGEYTYDYYEKVSENFTDVEDFQLWVVSPGGEIKELETTAGDLSYTAEFTPQESGIYILLLSSTKSDVVDWTEYDLGILKPNFYASTTVIAGGENTPTANTDNIPAKNALHIDGTNKAFAAGDTAHVSVSFEGEPVAEQEIIVSIADQWTKSIYTDEKGIATFAIPWEEQYILEAVYTEETPGRFKGKDFEAIRHTATYSIQTN